jgi:acyl carrier protein
MGGDSVQAMRLLLACSSEFGIEFSLQLLADLFRHDVREFTRVILAFTSCGGN